MGAIVIQSQSKENLKLLKELASKLGENAISIDAELNIREDKIALMQKAAIDPLYLADMTEIEDDFNFAGSAEK